MENLIQEVSNVQGELKRIHSIAIRERFNFSFLSSLDEAFACAICKRAPSRPPLIACSGCQTLVGCQKCVHRWFSGSNGLEKGCPKCRCSRGLSKSFILKGFNSLVDKTKELHRDSVTSSSDESSENELPVVLED